MIKLADKINAAAVKKDHWNSWWVSDASAMVVDKNVTDFVNLYCDTRKALAAASKAEVVDLMNEGGIDSKAKLHKRAVDDTVNPGNLGRNVNLVWTDCLP